MIKSPVFSPGHPDRSIDCEMSAEEDFRALAERIEAAGWSGDEAAAALLSLALNNVRLRRAAASTQYMGSDGRKKVGH